MSRNFVVAGGSHGIGREIVRRLLEHDNQVWSISRSADEKTADPGNLRNATHVHCDFVSKDLDAQAVASLLPQRIDGMVYCPGSIDLKAFRSLSLDDFLDDLQVNFLGAVRCLKLCAAGLQVGTEQGPSSVLMFSTVAVGQGLPMHASIASAKGAVEGLTRSLAAEWAPKVRVNCLAPALTDTPLAAKFFSNEQIRKKMAERYPLGRTGTADDLASIACFLLSDQASWITGQVLGVDGGMSTLRT